MRDAHAQRRRPRDRGLGRQAAWVELVIVLATVTLAAAARAAGGGRSRATGRRRRAPAARRDRAPARRRQDEAPGVAALARADLRGGADPAAVPDDALIALGVIPEWIRRRSDWYIVVFNVCNLVAPALLARAVFDAVEVEHVRRLDGRSRPGDRRLPAPPLRAARHGAPLRPRGAGRGHDPPRLRPHRRGAALARARSLPRSGATIQGSSPSRSCRSPSRTARSRSPRWSRRPASSPRPVSTTCAISRLRSARSSAEQAASTVRSPSSWSTSTTCARSTPRTGTWPATARCRRRRCAAVGDARVRRRGTLRRGRVLRPPAGDRPGRRARRRRAHSRARGRDDPGQETCR